MESLDLIFQGAGQVIGITHLQVRVWIQILLIYNNGYQNF